MVVTPGKPTVNWKRGKFEEHFSQLALLSPPGSFFWFKYISHLFGWSVWSSSLDFIPIAPALIQDLLFPPSGNTSRFSLSLVSSFLIHPTEDCHYLWKCSSHYVLFLLTNFQWRAVSSFFPHLPSDPARLVPFVFPELVPCNPILALSWMPPQIPGYLLILISTLQNPTLFSGHK